MIVGPFKVNEFVETVELCEDLKQYAQAICRSAAFLHTICAPDRGTSCETGT
jgi:hypothetical protein